MITALSTLVNAIAPIMTAQGTLLSANSVSNGILGATGQPGFGSASFDIFYSLAGQWIAAAGPIEVALASVMHSLVNVMQALAT